MPKSIASPAKSTKNATEIRFSAPTSHSPNAAVMAMLTDQGATLFEHACFNIPTLGSIYKTATVKALRTIEQ